MQYKLISIYPEVEEIFSSKSTEDVNNYIVKNIKEFKNHKKEWIDFHITEKQRHYMEIRDDDDKLKRVYIIVMVRLSN